MSQDLYVKGGKRALDLVAAAGVAVATFPLQVVIATSIWATMGTPVVYRQERPGRGEKTFTILKFRTMRDLRDGEDAADGARLTRLGRLLRVTSLDELPELYNVIRGEMSLVGPRPLLHRYLPFYRPDELRRHSVRPGITGHAQIQGRNTASWDERLANDVWYVDNVSLWVDIEILLKTVTKVLVRDGAVADATTSMQDLDAERSEQGLT